MRNTIIVLTWGGIGDLIVCTPTFRAIKEAHPQKKLIVYCTNASHPTVLLHNPYIDSVRMFKPRRMWRYPYHLYLYLFKQNKIKYYPLEFQYITPTIYKKHVKEIIPEIFSDLNIKVEHKQMQLYFTRKEETKAQILLRPFKNVVLIHIHSRSSVNHRWQQKNWDALVKSLPNFTFIQIGNPDEPYVSGTIDWRGKTTLREACCLLKYASSFVGVDSSMAHATNAVNLPGVVLWGDSDPLYWGHENNINIYKHVKCSPCYYYMGPDPCPYTHECMKLITVDEVRLAIIQQVSKYDLRFPETQISSHYHK